MCYSSHMNDKLVNPHDAFFKQYLSQPTVAADFMRHHLPAEVTALLDLSQLRLEKDSFVDEKLRSYFSDLIYTTMTKATETTTATPVSIAMLAEHKSYPDVWVDFQVLRYKVGYWVREFEAIEAAQKKQRTIENTRLSPSRTTLVKLDRAEITQKLLTYLPKEGGVLMETLAQEWIEEGKSIGFDLGEKEGIEQGIAAQQQTLLRLLQWRFALSPITQQHYAQQVARIHNLEHLLQLVDQALTLSTITQFDQALATCLPADATAQ